MKECKKCGNQFHDRVTFCSECGIKLESIPTSQNELDCQDVQQSYTQKIVEIENPTIHTLSVNADEKVETDENSFEMKPIVSIVSTVATLAIFFIVVDLFELKVNQIFSYVVYAIAGFAILAFMGATSTWEEKNGKVGLSKVSYIVSIIALLFLGYLCITDLYSWIFD